MVSLGVKGMNILLSTKPKDFWESQNTTTMNECGGTLTIHPSKFRIRNVPINEQVYLDTDHL